MVMMTLGLLSSLLALAGLPFMMSRRTIHMQYGMAMTVPFILFMLWLTFTKVN